MITEVRIPQLSVNDTTALIVDWTVKEGAFVHVGEEICVIETSKMTQSIVAERAGYIHLKAQVGDELDVQSVIALIGDRLDEEPAVAPAGPESSDGLEITRRARELAHALGIRLEDLPKKGRILRERDVREYAGFLGMGDLTERAATEDLPPSVSPDLVGAAVPLTRAQRLVKDSVLKSLGANAHSFAALDVSAGGAMTVVAELTQRLGHAVRLNDALIFAVSRALVECPAFNGFYWNDRFVPYKTVNIGLAVDVDGILIVPVIRDAQMKALAEIARESGLLQMKALRKSLSPAECEGGTFTLTNLGGLGLHTFVPIINGFQAAILAAGAVVRRPVMREGAWVEADSMTLGLSYDHRLNNGTSAGRLLNRMKAHLEKLAS